MSREGGTVAPSLTITLLNGNIWEKTLKDRVQQRLKALSSPECHQGGLYMGGMERRSKNPEHQHFILQLFYYGSHSLDILPSPFSVLCTIR